MGEEGVKVVRIPLGVAHVPILVVTDTGLPDGHEVGHTATVGRHRIDGVGRTAAQGGTTAGVLADGHAALQGRVKTSLVSQIHSYGQ